MTVESVEITCWEVRFMSGKNKCKILKDIRKKIADENDIPFVTEECKYKGDCTGTCPKCEAELVYLELELQKRQQVGKRIAVAGIATAAVLLTAQACSAIGSTDNTHSAPKSSPGYQLQGLVAEMPDLNNDGEGF